MSSWITNGLKTLRNRVGGAVGSVPQQRSPQQFGAQVKEVEIPQKPKKPLSPYFRFLGEVRSNVQKQNPSLKVIDLVKMIGQRWEQLDESAKQAYIASYKKDMISYSSILYKYKQSLTAEQIEAQQQLKMEKQLQKEKRDKKKRLKELGKPKRPKTAFFQFLFSNASSGTTMSDHLESTKKLAAEWKSMSEAEKAPYVAKYEAEKKDFENQLAKWEEKMMKQGNEDVVRGDSKKLPRSKVKG